MKDKNIDGMNLAAIDIGSNAARILIKSVEMMREVEGNSRYHTRKLQFLRIPLRLGMDVFRNGKISEEREQDLIRTIKVFRQLMIIYNIDDYRACATSAFRDARNGRKILNHIRRKLGVEIEIINGSEETRIVRDSMNQSALSEEKNPLLFMDVGGGSVELSLVSDSQNLFAASYNVGTLRTVVGMVDESIREKMLDDVRKATEGMKDIRIVGSGGNINKLIRLVPKKEKMKERFPVEALDRIYQQLKELSVKERMDMFDLRQDRADVIVPAAKLFLQIAEASGATEIVVPTVGLADGIINELIQNELR